MQWFKQELKQESTISLACPAGRPGVFAVEQTAARSIGGPE